MNNKDGCEKHPHMDMDEHCECGTIITNYYYMLYQKLIKSIKCFVNILAFELFVTMVTIEVYLKIYLLINRNSLCFVGFHFLDFIFIGIL